MADLDEIMSGSGGDSVVDTTAQTNEQTAAREDGRDENGRFASQQPPVTPPTETQEQRAPDGYVPIQALDARLAKQQEKLQRDFEARLTQERDTWQRQMTALQPPKPVAEPVKPPDFFENPDAAVEFRLKQALDPMQQSQSGIVENFSRMMASEKFGEDAVNTALAEMTSRVNANPQAMRFEYQRIMSAPHPYGELVKWHKNQTALNTYGDDPTAYREKLRAELMAEMQQGQQQQQQTPPVDPNSLPTSFNRNSGPSATPQWGGPRPLSDLMGR